VLDSDPVDQTQEVEEDLGLLYDSLEECNNSDSGPEMEDNESVHSTPKPTLRRFFEGVSHSGSQTEISSLHGQKRQERESGSPEAAEKRKAGVPRTQDEAAIETMAMDLEVDESCPGGTAEVVLKESSLDRLAQLNSVSKPEFPATVSPSKAENKQLWRPRSMSVKDRQNSKGHSDRTGSLDSESSPDSRQNTQVCLRADRQAGGSWGEQGFVLGSSLILLEVVAGQSGEATWGRGWQPPDLQRAGGPLASVILGSLHRPGMGPVACSRPEGCFAWPPLQVPRKSVYDQLNQILVSDEQLPESIILVNISEWQGQYLCDQLQEHKQPIVSTCSVADVQAAFNTIVARIQRYCNCNSHMPPPVKVAVAGDQSYLSIVLRFFVEQLASKTPDWLNYVRFLVVPLGSHPLAKYLGSVDNRYSALFLDAAWRELFSRVEPPSSDTVDVPGRVSQFITGANVSHQLPISEAMLTYKQKSPDEDSCQKFVPFVGVVKVGLVEQSFNTSVDSDDVTICTTSLLSSSSPSGGGVPYSKEAVGTPPPSPSVSSGLSGAGNLSPGVEVMGLQVDYWTTQGPEKRKEAEKRETGIKNTLKSNFRSLQVSRIPGPGELTPPNTMAMTVVTKEKNKKVMFLSKKPKDKDLEPKSQVIEGITRLICTAKHQNTMLRVCIDGVEWNDVKFFQLAAQWPTHVKHFPVGIFGYTKG
ncbi:Phosphofurin acidic cluster sorting protein 2, partial [Varanus komodoensis]